MCTQPIVAKKEEEETPADLEEEEEERGLGEEERLVELVGRAYPEDDIWEDLEEVSENSGEENAEDAEAEDEDVEIKEEAVPEEVLGDVGLRQRTVGHGDQAAVGNGQATVSCLFDGD